MPISTRTHVHLPKHVADRFDVEEDEAEEGSDGSLNQRKRGAGPRRGAQRQTKSLGNPANLSGLSLESSLYLMASTTHSKAP